MIADRLRAAILQAAISGKLTDQRTEDGTATELLEQIKTERAALVKAKKLQKQKALRPVTEQSQPFAIPTSWEWVRFQDVNQFRIGKTPKRAEPKFWSPSEVPWVSISDMTQGGSIASTKEGVSAAAIAECFGGQPSPAGTLIMSFKLTIGRCSFLGRDAVHNEAIVSIFPAMSAGESFSTYLSHALPLLSQLGDSKAAIKGNTLNSESIANLPIPLPPPMEQERIIAKLDEVLPLIDQLAELEREREHLDREFAKAIERAILQAATSGKLTDQRPDDGTAEELLETIRTERRQLEKEGKIRKQKPLPPVDKMDEPFDLPDSWVWSRLGRVFNMQAGKNVAVGNISEVGEYPCYGGNGIRGYVADYNRDGTYPLIGRQGALCGNINVASGRFFATEHAVVVETFGHTSSTWAAIALEQLNLNQYATATAQPGLSVEKLKVVPVPVPPVDEQERIAAKLDRALPLARGLGELVS
ncbi:restriction endonuclease subunit S [Corynebacterium haemomassiliense]|uniref:Restriction endonuclease subunit S n=2 Tax=Corynebacterium haemomassiliense TaxID=2754726 RepID=A0A7W2ECC1_9CORY|nr:restriction endonuclease subunit S [Corynebacterium haemomassiliense]MBA5245066.1 restriction endonuclease subunit S [Corynebacterium haemomassiliense]